MNISIFMNSSHVEGFYQLFNRVTQAVLQTHVSEPVLFTVLNFRIEEGKTVKVYLLLVVSALTGLSLYLHYWGLIGLRLWCY